METVRPFTQSAKPKFEETKIENDGMYDLLLYFLVQYVVQKGILFLLLYLYE